LGGLWRVIDFLNRGEFAAAGALRQKIAGSKRAFRSLGSGEIPKTEDLGALVTSTPEMLRAFWRGATGQERTTFPDILREDLGWVIPPGTPWYNPERAARGLLGFAGSVAIDPLTYVGIGTVGKLGKGEKAGRALLRIGGQPIIRGAKIGKPLFAGREGIRRLWQATRIPSLAAKIKSPIPWVIAKSRAAFTKKLPREFADTQKLLNWAGDTAHFTSHQLGVEHLNKMGSLGRTFWQSGMDQADLWDAVEYGLKHAPETISEEMMPFARAAREVFDAEFLAEKAANPRVSRLGENKFFRTMLDQIDEIDDQVARLQNVPASRQTLRQTVKLKRQRANLVGQLSGRQPEVIGQINLVGQEMYGGKAFLPFQDTSRTRSVLDEMLAREIDYAPHFESQQMMRIRNSLMPESLRATPRSKISELHGSMKPRHFVPGIVGRRPTFKEIRRAVNTPISPGSKISQYSVKYPWMSKAVPLEVGTEVLEPDFFYAGYVRNQMRAQATVGAEFTKRLRSAGADAPTALRTTELDQALFPGTRGRWFAPEEKNAIEATNKAFFSDHATRTLIQLEDKIHGAWRQWTLLPWFKFHSRNIVSAWWNSGLRDAAMYDPRHLGSGINNSRKVFFRGVDSLSQADKSLWIEAAKRRVVGGGFFTSATAGRGARRAVDEATGRWRQSILGRVRRVAETPLRLGAATAEISESGIRYAHFKHLVTNRGYSFDDAAADVMKYQFDYSDLSNFEANVLRRIFPLMTWTRKNVPLQIEHLLTKPGRYAGLGKFVRSVHGEQEEAGPLQTHLLPEWMQSSIPVRVWGGREKQQIVDMGHLLPTGELIPFAEVLRPDGSIDPYAPLQLVTEQLSPILKTPIELATRRQLFTGRSIRGREVEHIARTFFRGIGEYGGGQRAFRRGGIPALLSQRLLAAPTTFEPGVERQKQLQSETRTTKSLYTRWLKETDPKKKQRLRTLYEQHESRLRQILARPAFGG
jgi:hypothetical protein